MLDKFDFSGVPYDGNGNVTQITDALNNTRTFTYESTFSRVTSTIDPLGNTITFE